MKILHRYNKCVNLRGVEFLTNDGGAISLQISFKEYKINNMKKNCLFSLLFFISFNLFAEIKISTEVIKSGMHYSIDSSVNVRSEPNLKSDKIGKVNLGDKVNVLEKTEVYFESEGIYDCFYKVECSFGTGYMFGGYISDNADNLVFNGKEQVYFDKKYDYLVSIPSEISIDFATNLEEEDKDVLKKHYYMTEDFDILEFVEYADETLTMETFMRLEKILKNANSKSKKIEKSFSKLTFFTKENSKIIQNECVYSNISKSSIIKDQFSNYSFIALNIKEIQEPHYVEATDFYTFQNGRFVNKRRFATYARDGIYHSENTFVFPSDKDGKKNTVRIIGKYFSGNEVTEEYDVKTVWNGTDFIDNK